MGENTEAKKESAMLIVQSKVRDLIREKEMRTSDEFINALSEYVRQAVEKAVMRAKENGRSTLRPADLECRTSRWRSCAASRSAARGSALLPRRRGRSDSRCAGRR